MIYLYFFYFVWVYLAYIYVINVILILYISTNNGCDNEKLCKILFSWNFYNYLNNFKCICTQNHTIYLKNF